MYFMLNFCKYISVNMNSNLSESQTSEFKEAFSLFDKNGKGLITSKDLDAVMRSLGQNPTPEQLKTLIKQFDRDEDGAIDFEQFLSLMEKKMNETDGMQQMRQAFNLLDKKKMGYITFNDLKEMLMMMGEKLTQNKQQLQMRELLDEGDVDGDGKISFQDFYKVMSNR